MFTNVYVYDIAIIQVDDKIVDCIFWPIYFCKYDY